MVAFPTTRYLPGSEVLMRLASLVVARLTGSVWLAGLLWLAAAACGPIDTSRIDPARQARLDAEIIRHRAQNLTFRFTHDVGSRDAGWEDRLASIVVTDSTVLIHKNEKIGLEITPASRRWLEVARDHDRVRISAGSGKSRESWSFTPPDSAEAWTAAIRAVIRRSASVANR